MTATAPHPAVDGRRLAAAVHLDVVQLDAGRYQVTGGSEPHLVELLPAPTCDCADARIRGEPCKHRLAVALHRGHPRALAALRDLVAKPQRRPRRPPNAPVTIVSRELIP